MKLSSVCRGVVLAAWLLASSAGLAFGKLARTEYEMQAAFLYRFALFVEWPESAFASNDEGLGLCIVGSDPFGKLLERTIGDREVGGRGVSIRRIARGQDLSSCHVVYVPRSEGERTAEIFRSLDGQPALTVSDIDGFVERGGIIEIASSGSKLRFKVNVDAAYEAQLKIKSQLLNLAAAVRGSMRAH